MENLLLLFVGGLIAGLIDAIVGGGGLITVPSLTLVLGPGPGTIGTNKIVGFSAAFVALLIYQRAGHVRWRDSFQFSVCVAAGAYLGTVVGPNVPTSAFHWILIITSPLLLWIIWKRDIWVFRERSADHRLKVKPVRILFTGLLCGFYDGMWGPGGGTLMFLGLFFMVGLPLVNSIATTKVANSISALVGLLSYAHQGHVRWVIGLQMAFGISIGAVIGASFGMTHAVKIVRPLLILIVLMLLCRVLFEHFTSI